LFEKGKTKQPKYREKQGLKAAADVGRIGPLDKQRATLKPRRREQRKAGTRKRHGGPKGSIIALTEHTWNGKKRRIITRSYVKNF